MPTPPTNTLSTAHRPYRSDIPFGACLFGLGGAYVVLIAAMLVADAGHTSFAALRRAAESPEILFALKLSLVTSTIATLMSLAVAIPLGYLLSRGETKVRELRPGRGRVLRFVLIAVETLVEAPIVLPPLVVGLSLLILFRSSFLDGVADLVVYRAPAVVLAQFVVAAAFAIRTLRVTFDQIPVRHERIAQSLGASRGQAFARVALPQAWRGVVAAATLSWARSLGEFGPVLVFASAMRMRTEVLPTTVFLELQSGNLDAALAVSLVLVFVAAVVLVVARLAGFQRLL